MKFLIAALPLLPLISSCGVQPAAPTESDPIVGTYKVFNTAPKTVKKVEVWRIYPDGTIVKSDSTYPHIWDKKDGLYRVKFTYPQAPEYWYHYLKHQSLDGQPDFIDKRTDIPPIEGVKISSDPNFTFDFYRVGETPPRSGRWDCANYGKAITPRQLTGYKLTDYSSFAPNQYADSLAECRELCADVLAEWGKRFKSGRPSQSCGGAR